MIPKSFSSVVYRSVYFQEPVNWIVFNFFPRFSSSVLYSSSAEILLAKLDSYYLCGWHRWLMKDNKKKITLLVPLGPFSFRRRDGACSHNWKKIWKLVMRHHLVRNRWICNFVAFLAQQWPSLVVVNENSWLSKHVKKRSLLTINTMTNMR